MPIRRERINNQVVDVEYSVVSVTPVTTINQTETVIARILESNDLAPEDVKRLSRNIAQRLDALELIVS